MPHNRTSTRIASTALDLLCWAAVLVILAALWLFVLIVDDSGDTWRGVDE